MSVEYCKGCLYDSDSCMKAQCWSCCMGSKYVPRDHSKALKPMDTKCKKASIVMGLNNIVNEFQLKSIIETKNEKIKIAIMNPKDYTVRALKLVIFVDEVESLDESLNNLKIKIYDYFYGNKGGKNMPTKHDDRYEGAIYGRMIIDELIAKPAKPTLPKIKNVIFNKPATIVIWSDGTKTVVKTQDKERFNKEKGLAMAIAKKALGNQGNYYDEFKKWL